MSRIRPTLAFAGLICFCVAAYPQGPPQPPAKTVPPNQAVSNWSLSGSADIYLVPDGRDYVQPTITADRQWLHLEARYNTEDLDTGSAWVGYNFTAGKNVSLEFTPMIGGVFGRTTGVALGHRATLDWRRLELYSEDEWTFNVRERANSFFYTWSELTLAPVDWLRAGLVAQRTRTYKSARNFQRGFLVQLNFRRVSVTANVFNPDTRKPLYVISVDVEF